MIEFHLDGRSGVAPYLKIIQQVRQALRLGTLSVGDQLPTVKDVVATLAINPNTVLKAYRELDLEGLVVGRRGIGTFVSGGSPSPPPDGVKERFAERLAAGLSGGERERQRDADEERERRLNEVVE